MRQKTEVPQRSPEPCFKKKDSRVPICGFHDVMLAQKLLRDEMVWGGN